jgi:hypothetical protein
MIKVNRDYLARTFYFDINDPGVIDFLANHNDVNHPNQSRLYFDRSFRKIYKNQPPLLMKDVDFYGFPIFQVINLENYSTADLNYRYMRMADCTDLCFYWKYSKNYKYTSGKSDIFSYSDFCHYDDDTGCPFHNHMPHLNYNYNH